MLAAAATLLGGCVTGSLASNTGPRPPGNRWSVAKEHMVHVGEVVEFDMVLQDGYRHFVSPFGLADYCAAQIGPERVEVVADVAGHFVFSYRFDGVEPGERITVRASAYRQRGERDFMKVRGQWLHADSPYAQPDQRIAGNTIDLLAYRTTVELRMPRPPDDLDPETGVLRFRRLDGTTTPVYVDRPSLPGFSLEGPEPDGYYRVRYHPRAEELNSTGTTEAVFTIYDTVGRRHTLSTVLETP